MSVTVRSLPTLKGSDQIRSVKVGIQMSVKVRSLPKLTGSNHILSVKVGIHLTEPGVHSNFGKTIPELHSNSNKVPLQILTFISISGIRLKVKERSYFPYWQTQGIPYNNRRL